MSLIRARQAIGGVGRIGGVEDVQHLVGAGAIGANIFSTGGIVVVHKHATVTALDLVEIVAARSLVGAMVALADTYGGGKLPFTVVMLMAVVVHAAGVVGADQGKVVAATGQIGIALLDQQIAIGDIH